MFIDLESFPIRLVWRTDVHLADITPVSRLDDWAETIYDKLRQVGNIAKRYKAQAVLDGGDFFHVKSPSRTSHRLLRQVAEIHRHYPCPVYATVGNPDCVYGDIQWLHQQPLGVLFETGVFQRLYGQHEAVIQSGGVTVRVVGIPYHGTEYDLEKFAIRKGDEDWLVVVGHVLASDKTTSMYDSEDVVPYSYLRNLDADVFCFGHWHKDQGIVEVSPGKWVVNVGSLTRGSLSQDNLDRMPACVVLGFGSTVQLERFDLQVPPAAEVFDVQGRARTEARSMVIDGFIHKMQTALTNLEGKSLEDCLRELDGVPSQVRERALLILEGINQSEL